jgi:hypothetical protein
MAILSEGVSRVAVRGTHKVCPESSVAEGGCMAVSELVSLLDRRNSKA